MHYQKVRPSSDAKGQARRKRSEKPEETKDQTEVSKIDLNDPRLTCEILDVNVERDAFAAGRRRSDVIHVVVDSKLGTFIEDFHLKLLTEGDTADPSSVRGLIFGGEGRPKGASKEAVLDELDKNPKASTEEIAEKVGVTSRYVRQIKADKPTKPRKKRK